MAENDVQLVLSRLDALTKEIELVRTEQKLAAVQSPNAVTAASPWYVKWVQILGIPAIIVVILMNWGQFTLNTGTAEKTAAETQKVRVETLKTQAELQKALDDLEAERAKSPASAALNDTIDKLRQTLADATRLKESEVRGALTDIFLKFVIVWFVFQATALIFSIIQGVWGSIYSSLFSFVANWTSNYKGTAKRIITVLLPAVFSLFMLLPNIFLWFIELFIVFTLLQPIAYDASVVIGRPSEFSAFIAAAQKRQFHAAGRHLQTLLGETRASD